MLPSQLTLLIAWSCSSIPQMEEMLDCPKHTKVGQSLLCSTELAIPHGTGKRKVVNVVLLCASTISNCLQRGGIFLRSSTAASPPSPQLYQVSPADLGEAGITYPVKYRGYQLL